jgi:hypothetical protein
MAIRNQNFEIYVKIRLLFHGIEYVESSCFGVYLEVLQYQEKYGRWRMKISNDYVGAGDWRPTDPF